jgi:hypothetical protein
MTKNYIIDKYSDVYFSGDQQPYFTKINFNFGEIKKAIKYGNQIFVLNYDNVIFINQDKIEHNFGEIKDIFVFDETNMPYVNNCLIVLTNDNEIYIGESNNTVFKKIKYKFGNIVQIVGIKSTSEQIYILNDANKLYRTDGETYGRINIRVKDMFHKDLYDLYLIDIYDNIYQLDYHGNFEKKQYDKKIGNIKFFDWCSDDIYIVNFDNELYKNGKKINFNFGDITKILIFDSSNLFLLNSNGIIYNVELYNNKNIHQMDIKNVTNIIKTHDDNLFAISYNGVYAYGQNNNGQLGIGELYSNDYNTYCNYGYVYRLSEVELYHNYDIYDNCFIV